MRAAPAAERCPSVALAMIALLATAGGCDACGRNASRRSASEQAGRELLRCGDFLAAGEIKALGLDASHFNPDATQPDAVLGVRCDLGKLSATMYFGEQFPLMVADLKAAVASGQLQTHPGPTFGSDSYWTMMGKLHGLLFLASDKRHACSLAGRDQALIERTAQLLNAKMSAK